MKIKNCQKSFGFTLLEVMVALAIAAIGLGAISRSMSVNISVAERLEEKTIATWIASNQMAHLRMQRRFTSSGSNTGSEVMANRNWHIQENYYSTADPNIVRIEINIFHEEDTTHSVVQQVGYLSKYQPARSLPQ